MKHFIDSKLNLLCHRDLMMMQPEISRFSRLSRFCVGGEANKPKGESTGMLRVHKVLIN